jgi:hypothetical protein
MWTPEEGMAPSLISSGPVEITGMSFKVILRTRRAFGDAGEEHEVDWPMGWRLPHQGESVTVDGIAGVVSTIDFDLDRGIAVIWLR